LFLQKTSAFLTCAFLATLVALLVVVAPASADTLAFDDFTNSTGSLSSTWGAADYGGTWSEFATNKCDGTPTDFSVSGGAGVVATDPSAHDCQYLDIGQQTLEYQGNIAVSATPTGGSVWGYLGLRVQDRDNAYRIRVEFTTAGQAKCLMQKTVAGTTTTLPTTASTVTLSNLDYVGGGDKVNVKIQADAVNDTVNAKCWSAPGAEPAWQFSATAETTLEGATYDGIQARVTTAAGLTAPYPSLKFDDLDAHSLGHINPKVGAVGDVACSSTVQSAVWGGGEGQSGACEQKWVSDMVCDTVYPNVPTDSSCDTSDSTGSGYDKILGVGDLQYECSRPSYYTEGWKQLSGNGLFNIGWLRVQNVSNLFRPVPGNHETIRGGLNPPSTSSCGLNTAPGYDNGECFFQQMNGANGTAGDGLSSPCVPNANGDATPADATNGGWGYYSFDLGTWKIIALNSGDACSPNYGVYFPSCGTQKTWLATQLANNTQPCTLVYFHHPRISSEDSYQSIEGYDPDGAGVGEPGYIQQWWDEMYKGYDETRASYKTPDLVLNGHAHIYERFVKMDDTQTAAPTDGITQIIVGTGGKSHGGVGPMQSLSSVANGGNVNNTTYGMTDLTLEPNSFRYEFRKAVTDGTPTNGTFTEPQSSSVSCNN
jgi:hypothetical protein